MEKAAASMIQGSSAEKSFGEIPQPGYKFTSLQPQVWKLAMK